MPSLRFIHAADLHLDSPFVGLEGNLPGHIAGRVLSATFEAFDAIIELCLQEQVSALLVAGDIYDGADRSLKAQLRFVDGLERLDSSGIRAFICHGNHDPLNGWQARLDFPQNAHQFDVETEAVPLDPNFPDRATVIGVSYGQRDVVENLVPGFASAEKRGFSIGLLHCNAGGDREHQPYAACSITDLVAAGLDYWALGHVHRRQVLHPRNPVIVYPGNSQGRHLKEPGPRGVYLVNVSDAGQVDLDFRETSVLRWETVEVRISGLETVNALLDATRTAVASAREAAGGRDLLYRLRLTGQGPLHAECRQAGFSAEMQERLNAGTASAVPFAWCERIEVATAPEFDRTALTDGADYLGELLRLADSLRADPAELREMAAQFAQLYGSSKLDRFIKDQTLGDDDLLWLLKDAETAALEALS